MTSGPASIHGLVDTLAAVYADGPWAAEAAAARREYFERSGKVFDDDGDLFEARTASFLEWYVIERPLAGGPPPVQRALEQAGLPDDDRRRLAWLAASHRSLFDVCGIDGRVVDVEDVIGGARFAVVERRSTVGFAVGDLFEARLMFDGESVVFGKTFLFHPRDARAEALALIDGMVDKGVTREEITFHMSRLHVRWHRYGHVNAARVYRGEA